MKSGILSKKARRSRTKAAQKSGILRASLFGALVGLVLCIALLIVFCIACLNSKNPDALISPLALTLSSVSFFAAGFAASKKSTAPLPCGALSGALLCAAFFVISRALGDASPSDKSLGAALILRLVMLFICIVGALIGGNSRRRR